MTLYVGVDGGGSKTRVVAVDAAGAVRLDAETDGCDLPARGEAHVKRVLSEVHALVAGAARTAGGASELRLALGLPAYGETARWDEALRRLSADAFGGWRYRPYNDVRLALEGALPEGPGVLVLSGTGSMAWGKDAAGAEARAGGWGPLLGDEGSGYDLGLRGLHAAFKDADGRGPRTRLLDGLLRELQAADVHAALALLSEMPQPPRARIAALARVVLGAAEQGDAVAAALVDDAARELADHVEALSTRLQLGTGAAVSVAGGVFRNPLLGERLARELTARGYAEPVPPRFAPAFGGALLAGLDPAALATGGS